MNREQFTAQLIRRVLLDTGRDLSNESDQLIERIIVITLNQIDDLWAVYQNERAWRERRVVEEIDAANVKGGPL